MNAPQEELDRRDWWRSLKKGDRVVRVLLPGDKGYEESLAAFEKQQQEAAEKDRIEKLQQAQWREDQKALASREAGKKQKP